MNSLMALFASAKYYSEAPEEEKEEALKALEQARDDFVEVAKVVIGEFSEQLKALLKQLSMSIEELKTPEEKK